MLQLGVTKKNDPVNICLPIKRSGGSLFSEQEAGRAMSEDHMNLRAEEQVH